MKYESRTAGGEQLVRVSCAGETAEARKKTVRAAKEAAAKSMLEIIGPFVEDVVWQKYSATISDAVPAELKSALPAVFDARHLAMPGEAGNPVYEVEVTLGRLTAVSVSDSLATALSSLVAHLTNFLAARDIAGLLAKPLDESLTEMEVGPELKQPYVQTAGLIEVRLEDSKEKLVLPPVDVFTMQQHLPAGKFPPGYCKWDAWDCRKVFFCHRSMSKLRSLRELENHVRSVKYWRRIGKFFVNGQLRETFNPADEPFNPKPVEQVGETEQERHPMQDLADGRKVEKDDQVYLLTVYRSTIKAKAGPKPGGAFAPPMGGAGAAGGQFGGMYSTGNAPKLGWEDPNAPPGQPGPHMVPGWGGGPPQGWGGPGQGWGGQGHGWGGGWGGQGWGRGGGGQGWGGRGGGGGQGWGGRGGGGQGWGNQRWDGSRGGGRGGWGGGEGDQQPRVGRGAKLLTTDKRVEKYEGTGEVIMPDEGEEGNEAYTGMVGKKGLGESGKTKPRYAALPPPGHDQWNNISGNENIVVDNKVV